MNAGTLAWIAIMIIVTPHKQPVWVVLTTFQVSQNSLTLSCCQALAVRLQALEKLLQQLQPIRPRDIQALGAMRIMYLAMRWHQLFALSISPS